MSDQDFASVQDEQEDDQQQLQNQPPLPFPFLLTPGDGTQGSRKASNIFVIQHFHHAGLEFHIVPVGPKSCRPIFTANVVVIPKHLAGLVDPFTDYFLVSSVLCPRATWRFRSQIREDSAHR